MSPTMSATVVLSNVLYPAAAVVLAIIGGLLVALRHRNPKSVEANVDSFHRGLRALSPEHRPLQRGSVVHPPTVRVEASVRPVARVADGEADAG